MANDRFTPQNEEFINDGAQSAPSQSTAYMQNPQFIKESQPKKDKKKVGRAILCVALAIVCFLGGMLVNWLSLDREMRSLIRFKQAIQDNYYEEISDQQFYDTIFDAINDELLDDYSGYLTADEYAEMKSSGEGNNSGLGVVFSVQGDEVSFVIARVCGNSPAEQSGIVAGEKIVAFGTSETDMTDASDFTVFSDFIKAKQTGEMVYLRLQLGQNTRTVSVTKAEYVENYVFYRTNTQAYRFAGENATTLIEAGEPLTCLSDDTAYIRLTQFNGSAVEQFSKAMQLFKQQNKINLVLDLRDNGGGYVDIMQSIAGYFCKSATMAYPLVMTADYGEASEAFYAKANVYGEYFSVNSRICVLADEGTASASEALMGCMLDYGALKYNDVCLIENNGVAKTYGKGIMQTTLPLGIFQGDAAKLTTARIRWPLSEKCIQGVGICESDGTKSTQNLMIDEEEIVSAIALLGL